MKKSFWLLGLSVLLISTVHAASPLVDIVVSGDGEVSDVSKERRNLDSSKAISSPEPGAILHAAGEFIEVPYHEADPVFADGPLTWMVRCKFQSPVNVDPYPVVGRWDGAENSRIIALSIDQLGRPRFQATELGDIQSMKSVTMEAEVPVDTWVTLVGKYDPGSQLIVEMYDEGGNLVGERASKDGVPSVLMQAQVPIRISAPAEVGMSFGNLRIWSDVLTDEETRRAVKEGAED